MKRYDNRAKRIIFAELIFKFTYSNIKYDDILSITGTNNIIFEDFICIFDEIIPNAEGFSVKFAFIVCKVDVLICKFDDSGGETMAGKIGMVMPIYNKTFSRKKTWLPKSKILPERGHENIPTV